MEDRSARTGSTSLTLAWGRNDKLGGTYDALLAEMTRAFTNRGTVFWRVESTQVETDLLRTGVHVFQGGRKHAHVVENRAPRLRRRGQRRRDADAGAPARMGHRARADMVTGYAVPASLSPFYGTNPFSFQFFVRVRPPAMQRMVDGTMIRMGR